MHVVKYAGDRPLPQVAGQHIVANKSQNVATKRKLIFGFLAESENKSDA